MFILGRIAAIARCSLLLQTDLLSLSACLLVGHLREPMFYLDISWGTSPNCV